MKVVEGDPTSLLNRWPLLLDTDSIRSIGIAWGFKEDGIWWPWPKITGNVALFYNAIFFLRLSWPFGIFWMIRWCDTCRFAFWQSGAGWKLNGRFALLFRIQSDASAAAGVSGPNFGQATGFNYGPH